MRFKTSIVLLAMAAVLPFRAEASLIIGDSEWLQPADFVNYSWNDINTVCPAGFCGGQLGSGPDLTGWQWASAESVGALFASVSAHPAVLQVTRNRASLRASRFLAWASIPARHSRWQLSSVSVAPSAGHQQYLRVAIPTSRQPAPAWGFRAFRPAPSSTRTIHFTRRMTPTR